MSVGLGPWKRGVLQAALRNAATTLGSGGTLTMRTDKQLIEKYKQLRSASRGGGGDADDADSE